MSDLTFQEVNTKFGTNIFTFDTDKILLNVTALTGDNNSALTDNGIVEFCFKLLKICQETQTEKNISTTVKLSSFGTPFYSTVTEGNPPTITGTASVSAVIPLNIDELTGNN